MNDQHGGWPALSVENVVITHQLDYRLRRSPDYATENRALATLAQELAEHPGGVLQRVAELAMELCRADSAGISVLEPGGKRGMFRWAGCKRGLCVEPEQDRATRREPLYDSNRPQ